MVPSMIVTWHQPIWIDQSLKKIHGRTDLEIWEQKVEILANDDVIDLQTLVLAAKNSNIEHQDNFSNHLQVFLEHSSNKVVRNPKR